ncbi:MAG: hypothetical protein SWQ30_08415 [Thermodesulfobacteriota bacterium]|nr:hypothetical protein [Thermodesulfobacteriota bacterium]
MTRDNSSSVIGPVSLPIISTCDSGDSLMEDRVDLFEGLDVQRRVNDPRQGIKSQ